MDETLEEYREWSGCDVDHKTMTAYTKALEIIKKLTPLEDALVFVYLDLFEMWFIVA